MPLHVGCGCSPFISNSIIKLIIKLLLPREQDEKFCINFKIYCFFVYKKKIFASSNCDGEFQRLWKIIFKVKLSKWLKKLQNKNQWVWNGNWQTSFDNNFFEAFWISREQVKELRERYIHREGEREKEIRQLLISWKYIRKSSASISRMTWTLQQSIRKEITRLNVKTWVHSTSQ